MSGQGWYTVLARSVISGDLEPTSVDLYSLGDAAREARRSRGLRVIAYVEPASAAPGMPSHTATVIWQGSRVPEWLGASHGTGPDGSRAARSIAAALPQTSAARL